MFAGGALYRSLDGGDTFTVIETSAGGGDGLIGSNGALDRFPADSPYPLRLVSGDSPSVVYSDDGGDSWTRAETAPQHQAFRLHTFRSGRVLSVGFFGAALSTDGGVTFSHIPALYDTTRVAFDLTELVVLDGFVTGEPGDSEEGRVLVIGTEAGRPGTHVWASDDEGDSWRQVHQFEWGGTWNSAAAVPEAEAGEPGWAVAAEDPGRVFATVDGGETWVRIGAVPGAGESPPGGGYVRVQTMEVGPDGRLYAGTSRSGPEESWSYRSRERIAEVIRFATAADEVVPGAGSLGLTVQPNPSSSTTEVVVRLGAGAPPTEAVVTVTDVRGREVARLGGGVAGAAAFRLETSGWASGVYVVRVTAGTEAATATLTVAR
ncbi:MAG: T9SS type A sorting domain-containing protein [Bacteroidota bacterium]